MKSKLGLKTQGVRGGNPWWTEDNGYVAAFIDDKDGDSVVIDAFSGFDDEYKRRERCEISIKQGYSCIFVGTFDELCSKLISKR